VPVSGCGSCVGRRGCDNEVFVAAKKWIRAPVVAEECASILRYQMVLSLTMKGETIAMDGAGRVVLPKPVREELNLVAGDKLRLSVEGNSIRLEPTSEKGEFVRKGSVLVLTSKFAAPVTTQSVEQLLAKEREAGLKAATKLRNK